MSARYTSLGPAKAALKTLWSAALADQEQVQVTYGKRVTVARAERVTIGGARGETKPQSLGPRRQMREGYDIQCGVSVSRNGTVDDQQAVTERCLEIVSLLEETLRALPSENLALTDNIDVYAVVQGDWEFGESEASETGGPVNAWYEFNVHIEDRFRLQS